MGGGQDGLFLVRRAPRPCTMYSLVRPGTWVPLPQKVQARAGRGVVPSPPSYDRHKAPPPTTQVSVDGQRPIEDSWLEFELRAMSLARYWGRRDDPR